MSTSCEHGVPYDGPDECEHCIQEEEKDNRIAALQQQCDSLRASFYANKCDGEALRQEIRNLHQERDQLQSKLALLTDPAAVHANILRGTLPLTKAQAIHIAGLPADVERIIAELKEQERSPVRHSGAAPVNLKYCGRATPVELDGKEQR